MDKALSGGLSCTSTGLVGTPCPLPDYGITLSSSYHTHVIPFYIYSGLGVSHLVTKNLLPLYTDITIDFTGIFA